MSHSAQQLLFVNLFDDMEELSAIQLRFNNRDIKRDVVCDNVVGFFEAFVKSEEGFFKINPVFVRYLVGDRMKLTVVYVKSLALNDVILQIKIVILFICDDEGQLYYPCAVILFRIVEERIIPPHHIFHIRQAVSFRVDEKSHFLSYVGK